MIEPNWILQRIEISPKQTALIDVHSGKQWTFHELRDEIKKWTAFFKTKDLRKGDRIAVLSQNNMELFPILFACGLNGYIYVPINFRLNIAEIKHVVKDSGAMMLLYDAMCADTIESISAPHKIGIAMVEDREIDLHVIAIHREDPWMMIYTGGTTGKPKGVVLSHEAVNFNAMNTIISWGLCEEDTTINYMPFFHTGGINALCMPILMAGGTVVMGNTFSPEEALKAIDDYKASICLFVPTMYQAMQQEDLFHTSTFPSMKVFLSGGAPCPPTVYDKFKEKGLAFKEGYGLTEAGPNNFFIRPEIAKVKNGSVGKSMLFNDVQVVNEDGTLCKENEVGELYVKGKHVFTAYWNQEKETKEAFMGEWFKTGDLAKFDQDGDFYIVGRKKDMIITGGENVYPQEVEQCIQQHPFIREAAVIGVPDGKWGEKVVAFITVKDGVTYKEEEFVLDCKSKIASYKVPKNFHLLNDLPKTDVGKIDKNQLLHIFLAGGKV